MERAREYVTAKRLPMVGKTISTALKWILGAAAFTGGWAPFTVIVPVFCKAEPSSAVPGANARLAESTGSSSCKILAGFELLLDWL